MVNGDPIGMFCMYIYIYIIYIHIMGDSMDIEMTF